MKYLNKVKIIFLFLILTLFFVGLFIYSDKFFRIKEIEVIGIDAKNSIKGINIFNNKNLFFVNEQEVSKQIINVNSQVKSVTIKKIYPQTLLIEITYDQVVAYLKASDGYFYLSRQAKIIFKKKEKDVNLTVINYYQKPDYYSYNSGDNLDFKDILSSLEFLNKGENLGYFINAIDINGFNMIALKTADKTVIFTMEKDQNEQINEWEIITKQLKIKGLDYKKLDLRFDKPIIELK